MSARHDTDLLSQAQQRRRKDEALSKIIGVDIKCLHLARHFLTDLTLSDNAVVNELAWHIQKTVGDFLTRSTERNSMKCEYCGGSGKIDINEPGAYGYMTCDKCDGYGAMCDICGRPMLLGECEWCALARAEGESFVKTHGLPWDRP